MRESLIGVEKDTVMSEFIVEQVSEVADLRFVKCSVFGYVSVRIWPRWMRSEDVLVVLIWRDIFNRNVLDRYGYGSSWLGGCGFGPDVGLGVVYINHRTQVFS